MKHLSVFLLGLFFGSSIIFAQCTPPVSPSSEVITGTIQKTKSDSYFWVCNTDTFNLTGGFNTIYVEDNSVININGDSNIVFQKSAGTLSVAGTGNTVNVHPTVSFSDNGTFTTKNNCSSMVFDYAEAPVEGCDVFAGLTSLSDELSFSIYPIPASGTLFIELNPAHLNGRFNIISLDGKKMASLRLENFTNSIDISYLKPGVYIAELISEESRFVQKLVIE